MNTHTLTTLSHGPHTAKPAVAARMRAIADAHYAAAKLNITPVIVCELRAHGNFTRALKAVNVDNCMLARWRKRDAALNRDVRLAVQFAASDAVDYGKWVTR